MKALYLELINLMGQTIIPPDYQSTLHRLELLPSSSNIHHAFAPSAPGSLQSLGLLDLTPIDLSTQVSPPQVHRSLFKKKRAPQRKNVTPNPRNGPILDFPHANLTEKVVVLNTDTLP